MDIELSNIPSFEPKQVSLPHPAFLDVSPDFDEIARIADGYSAFKNVLIIGHGGSVSSSIGILGTLNHPPGKADAKRVEFLSTVDPEYIAWLHAELPKHETLVIAVSKSGENITQLEAVMHFLDYRLFFITGKGSTLDQMGKKAGAVCMDHPPVGGRFTAFTNVAMLPAAICGVDVRGLWAGAQQAYAQYEKPSCTSMRAAQAMYALEQQGVVDVFMPFYSHAIFSFSDLVVQLCHESFGKNGFGQTYFTAEAPESQHHTNQRFFGGRKNIAGFFVHVEHFRTDEPTVVPTSMHSIHVRDGSLHDLNKLPLSSSMECEYLGTWRDAKAHGIPCISLNILSLNPEHIGEFIAFWHMYVVFSSVLRGVDPFDQPQVESSKLISWTERKAYRGE